jgi:hypothetical protein
MDSNAPGKRPDLREVLAHYSSPDVHFRGEIVSVQPRIQLQRSFDQVAHSYLGYALLVRQEGGVEGDVAVGIGPGAQAKHHLKVGDVIEGAAKPVHDVRLETVRYYKVTGLKVISRRAAPATTPPPWTDVPPELPVYRARGHRRLDARTYAATCASCMWGCNMAVEMIIDHWNPEKRKYRTETFCSGPKSCPFYRAGPKRVVPGRKGMKHVEEDWIDEEATRHRGPDE